MAELREIIFDRMPYGTRGNKSILLYLSRKSLAGLNRIAKKGNYTGTINKAIEFMIALLLDEDDNIRSIVESIQLECNIEHALEIALLAAVDCNYDKKNAEREEELCTVL